NMLSFLCAHPSTTEIYTLSLHDALPICTFTPTTVASNSSIKLMTPLIEPPARKKSSITRTRLPCFNVRFARIIVSIFRVDPDTRSEEHTSELQSRFDLVCRLLLEKKKNT